MSTNLTRRVDAHRRSLEARLLAKSTRDLSTGCLRWKGVHNHRGYGVVSVGGRSASAHRAAYELWVGPIPEGLQIDHVYARGCRHRDCIEPSHLEPVTFAENIARRVATQTHCANGHEFTPDNVRPGKKDGEYRRCYECTRKWQVAYKYRVVSCPLCGREMLQGNLSRHNGRFHAEQIGEKE